MTTEFIDGIKVRYEVHGKGPPLLMFAPGGFDSTIEMWSKWWRKVQPIETFSQRYTCIVYDRREAGASGGRIERLSWGLYANQGKLLLDHLGFEKAFLLGGCMGVPLATAFAIDHPERTLGAILHFPVGGPWWRIMQQSKFAEHVSYVQEKGLQKLVQEATGEPSTFSTKPHLGPWTSVLENDASFADGFLAQDPDRYMALIASSSLNLFDRDTASGADPEELMAMKLPTMIIPGADQAHATSAARYLHECIPHSEYKDVPVPEQPPLLGDWIMDFLDRHSGQESN